ncbi:MAG TPA: general secretion pathway protein GspB [Ramlibacter sp.]|nr:general secretion pathway protein GspB [Ramlibacter sp.]
MARNHYPLTKSRCSLARAAVMTLAAGAWYPAAVAQPLYAPAPPASAAGATAPVPAAGVPAVAAPQPAPPPLVPPAVDAPSSDSLTRGSIFRSPESTPPALPPVAAPPPPPPAVAAPRPPLPPSPPSSPVKGLPPDAPQLVISGGVYSPNPHQRMLIVNGKVVKEGADLGSGVVLEQITPDGVVLAFRGSHYRLMY